MGSEDGPGEVREVVLMRNWHKLEEPLWLRFMRHICSATALSALASELPDIDVAGTVINGRRGYYVRSKQQ